MVDMSREAVGQRLRLMDELWELSVSLMNSSKVASVEESFRFEWVYGDGGPLIAMEESLLDFWEGSDAPSNGRVVHAESRWGLDVATDYDVACDVNEIAGVIEIAGGHALVLSTEQRAMTTWLSSGDFAGALVEWEYGDAEDIVIAEALDLIKVGTFSQSLELSVNSSPMVLFVAAERGREPEGGYARNLFELAPGCYTVKSGRRETDRTSVVCHLFELKTKSI